MHAFDGQTDGQMGGRTDIFLATRPLCIYCSAAKTFTGLTYCFLNNSLSCSCMMIVKMTWKRCQPAAQLHCCRFAMYSGT